MALRRAERRAPWAALAALALPVVLVAPWLVDNELRYHALTAVAIVRLMQGGFFNHGGHPYGLSRLVDASAPLLGGILPEEWNNAATIFDRHALNMGLLHVIRVALVAWMFLPFGGWLWRGPRRVWPLVAPVIIAVALMWIETIVERLPLITPRYAYAVLPAFGLACGLALARPPDLSDGNPSVRSRPAALPLLAGVLTVLLGALWLYLTIAVHPLTNSGA